MVSATSTTRNTVPVTTLRRRFISPPQPLHFHSLVQRPGRAQAPVVPFLDAFAFTTFAGVHVSTRIDTHTADGIEQTGIPPAIAEPGHGRQRVPLQNPDRLVKTICNVQEALLRIVRK